MEVEEKDRKFIINHHRYNRWKKKKKRDEQRKMEICEKNEECDDEEKAVM